MVKIKSKGEMISFQKKILTQLNNDLELQNLKLTFYNDPTLPHYSNVFYYLYNNINTQVKKIKAYGDTIYTITFNYTNIAGVVLYDNTFIIQKCKKINYYSTNTDKIMLKSFNDFVKGNLFAFSVQNQLAQQQLSQQQLVIPSVLLSTDVDIETGVGTGVGAGVEVGSGCDDEDSGVESASPCPCALTISTKFKSRSAYG